jgi:hypothetical protein
MHIAINGFQGFFFRDALDSIKARLFNTLQLFFGNSWFWACILHLYKPKNSKGRSRITGRHPVGSLNQLIG